MYRPCSLSPFLRRIRHYVRENGEGREGRPTSGERLSINPGTLYPILLKLEQEGSIASEWGVADNKRKARFYRITKFGKRDLARTEQEWERTKEIVERFQSP